MLTFSHLQLHSHYSVSEGLCQIPDIAEKAKSSSITTVALTDVDNMFGWVKFYAKMRGVGVKPIAGADLLLCVQDVHINITALCLNNEGYQQLIHLISHAYLEADRVNGRPVVQYESIKKCEDVVIILHARG